MVDSRETLLSAPFAEWIQEFGFGIPFLTQEQIGRKHHCPGEIQ